MSNNNMQLGIESVNYEGQPAQGNNKDLYKGRKKKFGRTYINILHDPRVVRGNTYAAFVIPSSLQMEFIRLKEEEQRRKRLMNIPKRLPRVAHLGKKKTKEDSYFEEQQEEERPESPILKKLDDPEYIEDRPYFFEDRPPTPVYVPKPPGVEIATQIQDGELFDFDLEVEPILEVLIGRSLVQATYELIEEHEREEYLLHKKNYEQKREFELINLQRMEAARIRREQEKERRHNQTVQKKLYDTSSQKKLIAKLFAKNKLNKLDVISKKQLYQIGFLKERFDLKLSSYMQKDIFPVTNKLIFTNNEVRQLVSKKMFEMKKKDLSIVHNDYVSKENERIRKLKEEIEKQKQLEIENEKKRLRDKADRKENRRINRITNNINENVISTKDFRQDIASLSLCDIDDFSMYSESIHVTGGLLGLVTIILDELLKVYNLTENTPENINLIASILEEFILKCLKDNQSFELKYLESNRFNFGEIPEERKSEFIDFIHDYRRFVNKSLKLLLDKNQIPRNSLDLILSAIVSLYFKDKSNIPPVEVNPENQDAEYIEKMKHEQEEYLESIARMEAVKKKIKFVMIKPAILKKRRDNMAAFIQVHPNLSMKDSITEADEVPQSERPKTSANAKNEENAAGAGASGNNEENAEEDNAGNEDENEEENQDQNVDNDGANNNDNVEDKENANLGENNEEKKEENQGDEEGNNKENTEDQANSDDPNNANKGASEENKAEEDKIQPKVFKIDYYNDAQVFKNATMKYEPYVIHHKIQQYSLINVAKSFRRVLKKNMKIDPDLNELVNVSNHAYEKYTQYVIDSIMSNEIYIKEKIVPITAHPLETKVEEPVNPNNALENQMENSPAENPGDEDPQAAQE